MDRIGDSRNAFLGSKGGVVEISTRIHGRRGFFNNSNGELTASFNLLGHERNRARSVIVVEAVVIVLSMGIIPGAGIDGGLVGVVHHFTRALD